MQELTGFIEQIAGRSIIDPYGEPPRSLCGGLRIGESPAVAQSRENCR